MNWSGPTEPPPDPVIPPGFQPPETDETIGTGPAARPQITPFTGVSPIPPPPPPPPTPDSLLAPGGWAPGPDRAPAPRRRLRRPWVLASIAGVCAVALAGAAIGVFAGDDGGPDYPEEWDQRVVDLVDFVERERGLTFDHPVDVDFLPDAAFLAEIGTDDSELDDDEQAERDEFDRQYTAAFRALGVAEGDISLFDEAEALTDAGTVAFYRFRDDRIIVRGTELDTATKVTVVHELTHALQDQHFDLDSLNASEDDDEYRADPTALVEGDATRIENAYVDELSASERREYERQSDDQVDDDAFDDIPLILQLLRAAPYTLGNQWIAVIETAGGDEAIDAAFENPPLTDEHYFDPASFDRRTKTESVETFSEVDDDVTIVVDNDQFGSLGWYLMLGEQIDSRTAMQAALGWGGDAYRIIDDGDDVCAQLRFVGDTGADTDEMFDALEEWRDALPFGDDIDLDRDGDEIDLESCDPGVTTKAITTDDADIAFTRQFVRLQTIRGLIDDDVADLESATCFADHVAIEISDDDLVSEEISTRGRSVIFAGFAECDIEPGG